MVVSLKEVTSVNIEKQRGLKQALAAVIAARQDPVQTTYLLHPTLNSVSVRTTWLMITRCVAEHFGMCP
jgi:hypothetical protein